MATLESKLTKITGRQPLKKNYDRKAKVNSTNKWAYYWMHGYTYNMHHNSMTCYQCAEGYQTDTTASNKMGGCTNHIGWLIGEDRSNLNSNAYFACDKTCLNPAPLNNLAAADTGATANYLMINVPDGAKEIACNLLTVILPNGQCIKSQKTHLLPLPSSIPKAAWIVNSFKHLTEGALLSIGQLCDSRCIATFNNAKITIQHNNKVVLIGYRNYKNRLWCINLSAKPNASKQPIY